MGSRLNQEAHDNLLMLLSKSKSSSCRGTREQYKIECGCYCYTQQRHDRQTFSSRSKRRSLRGAVRGREAEYAGAAKNILLSALEEERNKGLKQSKEIEGQVSPRYKNRDLYYTPMFQTCIQINSMVHLLPLCGGYLLVII